MLSFQSKNKKVLGTGGFGTVFLHEFKGKEVAVKRVELVKLNKNKSKNEEAIMKELDHENVVKLLHVEDDRDFRYFVLELCEGSLDQLYLPEEDERKYRGPKLPYHLTVLIQLASGMEHIHSKNVIHRDIKPANVLISVDSTSKKVRLKWADFGLSRPTSKKGTYLISQLFGTDKWLAPELLKQIGKDCEKAMLKGTMKSDIFVEGLVFSYILNNGKHPYGKTKDQIESNIKKGNPADLIDSSHYARELIVSMLANKEKERIESSVVVEKLQVIQNQEEQLLKLCSKEYPDHKLIQEMINNGVYINCENADGLTPLLLLANQTNFQEEYLDLIKFFIAKGVDVKRKDSHGFNALHFFCQFYPKDDLFGIIKLFTETEFQLVNSQTNNGWNALHLVCQNYSRNNFHEIVEYLVDRGIDVHFQSNYYGTTALHFLCQNYTKEDLMEIIQLVGKSEVENKYGWNVHNILSCYHLNNHLEGTAQLAS